MELLLSNPTVLVLTAIQVVLGVLPAFYFGPLPALLSELFATKIRTTGLAISYNFGVTLFGGFAPLILARLIDATGSLPAPGYYYTVVALVSLAGLPVARRFN